MINFLPPSYPDEYFYSLLTRYHIRSANKKFRQTLLKLLEYSSEKMYAIELPSNLDYLISTLPPLSPHTAAYLIDNHTLYPFYSSFLTVPEAWTLKDRMRKKSYDSLFQFAKLRDKLDRKHFLQFCPLCLEENDQQYGEAYWHRFHQIPGVFVCLLHQVVLHNSSVPMVALNQTCSPANTSQSPVECKADFCSEETVLKLLTLAEDIQWLIRSGFQFRGLSWLRKQYQRYLIDRNFARRLPRSRFELYDKQLAEAMLTFYGEEFFQIVKPDIMPRFQQHLQFCLLTCDVNPYVDRVMHLLLIRFLAPSPATFFSVYQ